MKHRVTYESCDSEFDEDVRFCVGGEKTQKEWDRIAMEADRIRKGLPTLSESPSSPLRHVPFKLRDLESRSKDEVR